jgi:hypothetical protein
MRHIIAGFIILSFVSCSTYRISNSDLKTQLESLTDSTNFARYNTDNPNAHGYFRIACIDKNNHKVWLYLDKNVRLHVKPKSTKSFTVLGLTTVKFKYDSVFGIYSGGIGSYKRIPFLDIDTSYIIAEFARKSKYFNNDSLLRIAESKNDSIKKIIDSYSFNLLHVNNRIKSNRSGISDSDSGFNIGPNLICNLRFANDLTIYQGLVTKITNDSIFLTNCFSDSIAHNFKIKITELGFKITEMTEILLQNFYTHKYTFVHIKDCELIVKNVNNKQVKMGFSPWFAVNEIDGIVFKFYPYLFMNGYFSVIEKGGKLYL